MWIEKLVMLNRAIFEGFFARLSQLFGIIKPRPRITTTPEVFHHTVPDDFLNKFDEVLIIGDVHGCYDELMILLDQAAQSTKGNKVDPKRILKICVGDLINKGPKNLEVIDFMMNNSDTCLAVRGNHDEVVIREYVKYLEKGEIVAKNAWMKQLNRQQLDYLIKLPYTISIPKLNILVVHAGLVPQLALEKQELNSMTNIRNLVESKDGEKTVYRASISAAQGIPWASEWKGPSHIYFGHDAVRKLQEYPFATGLDTGAVYGGSLTAKFVLGPRNGDYLSVKALKVWKDPFMEKSQN